MIDDNIIISSILRGGWDCLAKRYGIREVSCRLMIDEIIRSLPGQIIIIISYWMPSSNLLFCGYEVMMNNFSLR